MHVISLLGQMGTTYADPYYQTTGPTAADAALSAGAVFSIMLFMLVPIVIAYVVSSLFLARIFKKAGVEGWKAWIPVYNNWVTLELGDQKGYWAVLAFVPLVGIASVVFMYIAMYHIGLKLGKEGVFVLLAIFLPLVWTIWLAVDSSTWKGAPLATYPTNAQPQPPVATSATPPQDTPPPHTL